MRVKNERVPGNLSKSTLSIIRMNEDEKIGWGRRAQVVGRRILITYRNGKTARFAPDGTFERWLMKK